MLNAAFVRKAQNLIKESPLVMCPKQRKLKVKIFLNLNWVAGSHGQSQSHSFSASAYGMYPQPQSSDKHTQHQRKQHQQNNKQQQQRAAAVAAELRRRSSQGAKQNSGGALEVLDALLNAASPTSRTRTSERINVRTFFSFTNLSVKNMYKPP